MNNQEKPAEIQQTEISEFPEKPKEKKIIHFASGETLEVQDIEEEEESSPKRSPFQEPAARNRFSFKKMVALMGRLSLRSCDFLGKKFAAALGLNVAKYQYAIDQYHRDHKATRSRAVEGPVESIQLSCGLAGSRYGTTGDLRDSSQEKHEDSTEGRHNRAYQEDEVNSK